VGDVGSPACLAPRFGQPGPNSSKDFAMPNPFDPRAEPLKARVRLVEIVRARSFRSGREFTLASGKTSTIYFNLKPTMLTAEGAHLISSLLLDALADDGVAMVGGLELGAVPLAASTAAIAHAQGRPVDAFLVRKEAKGHGTKSLIEGLPEGESLKGMTVAVLEDVTTTGGSALKAIAAVTAEGARVARVVTVLDRQEGAAAAFAEAGVPFTALLTKQDFVP
jgi:orotate phosphoribosyltransferase